MLINEILELHFGLELSKNKLKFDFIFNEKWNFKIRLNEIYVTFWNIDE